jgi:hypothetical protein
MMTKQDPVVDDNLDEAVESAGGLLEQAKIGIIKSAKETVLGKSDKEVNSFAEEVLGDKTVQKKLELNEVDKDLDKSREILGGGIIASGLAMVGLKSSDYLKSRDESEKDLSNLAGDVLSVKDVKNLDHAKINEDLALAKETLSVLNIDKDLTDGHPVKKKKFREILQEARDVYEGKDVSFKNVFGLLGNVWEKSKWEDDNIFLHFFRFIKQLFIEGKKWQTVRKLEKGGVLEKVDELKETVKTIKDEIGEDVKVIKEKTEDVDEVSSLSKENPVAMSFERINNLRKFLNSSMTDLTARLYSKKIGQKEYARRVQNLYKDVAKKGQRYPSRFKEFVKKGQMHGFTLRTSGKFVIVEVLNRSIMEAIESGKYWEGFKHSISSSNVLVEMVPGVGTWKSGQRFFDAQNPDPFWVKSLDFGLNLAGDVMLAIGVAGAAFTGGASLAVAVALRGGVVGAGKSLLKKAAVKVATKEGAKGVAKSSVKFVGSVVSDLAKLNAFMFVVGQAVKSYFPEKEVIEKFAIENFASKETKKSIEILNS